MYLTTIDHAGQNWDVELRVIRDELSAGTLEFTFVSCYDGGAQARYAWDVSTELGTAPHLEGGLSKPEVGRIYEGVVKTTKIRTGAAETQESPPRVS